MFKGTTIVSVRRGDQVALCGDGQISLGNTIVKASASKVRRLAKGKVVVGFAGSTADAITLFEKLERRLAETQGSLRKAAVEVAKDWRGDKYLRQLEALMVAIDATDTLVLSGAGDVFEPEEGVIAVGSGGSFALAAARALTRNTELSAEEIARKSLEIASEICVFTNNCQTMEVLENRKAQS